MIQIKPRWFALGFLLFGFALGILTATAFPIVEHWPDLTSRSAQAALETALSKRGG